MKYKRFFKAIYVALCLAFVATLYAQTYEVGEVYYGRNSYVEYYPGDVALIVTAPHGGDLTPAEIPDRTWGTTVTDSYTKETAIAVRNAVFEATGGYPHIIISNLKRTKLDPNREILEAAQENQWAEQAWTEYHGFINIASDSVESQYGKGFIVDIHGHGHTLQRLELGYLLSATTLMQSDNVVNSYASNSSIRALAENSDLSFADLIRGANSLGALFEEQGISAVPSLFQPDPGDGNPYFSGGYTTQMHGSSLGGNINAVQIEAYRVGLRDTDTNRKKYAEAITAVFDEYFHVHFGWAGIVTGIQEERIASEGFYLVQNYPNPFNPSTTIRYSSQQTSDLSLVIYDISGRMVKTVESANRHIGDYEYVWNGQDNGGITVPTGIYFAKLQSPTHSQVIKMHFLK
ncbi:MAG: T9SS type A sorting domain-containing protein [Candidatus Marinimicrobia bacterium]|nr:T9SS type A sorting domain-containing protein [Candidatus Neomarinimicrobiota bacterium]